MSADTSADRFSGPRAGRPHMPGYGVVDAHGGKGLLPWSWAVDLLSKARNYWFVTTRPDGRPHAMPVWGVWLASRFYFSTGGQSRKAKNIAANPRCVVGLDRDLDAVVVEGLAGLVAGVKLRQQFIDAYAVKYDWDMTGFEEPVFVVRPLVVFGFAEGLEETATRWIFEEAGRGKE
jgi:general stress protein 26